jgi:hypothetical protein
VNKVVTLQSAKHRGVIIPPGCVTHLPLHQRRVFLSATTDVPRPREYDRGAAAAVGGFAGVELLGSRVHDERTLRIRMKRCLYDDFSPASLALPPPRHLHGSRRVLELLISFLYLDRTRTRRWHGRHRDKFHRTRPT